MPLSDMPLADLSLYRPEIEEPADFDTFWATTLNEARSAGAPAQLHPTDSPLTQIIVEDLVFPGYAGEPIRAWVSRPPGMDGPLPAVVEYQGYGGGRGLPEEHVRWALAGYVHVFMDTRGQGGGWGQGGATPDPHGSESMSAGFMTKGIADPASYYYRRVLTDAVRLVESVHDLPFVDPDRVVVSGASQGGGIALGAAALAPGMCAVLADVAFLCAYRRGAEVAAEGPFRELAQYLSVYHHRAEEVFRTLSYFDGVNFARRIDAPTLFSVALMDMVVPPSTTFAAYNHLACQDRSIEVYPFNNHEGGGAAHWRKQVAWLRTRLAPKPDPAP